MCPTGEKPLVSVIIPTHNRPEHLRRALLSVVNQTYSEVEIIVVDDASSQDLKGMVKELSNPCVTFIRHQTNRGASAARNTGLNAAQGKYINFLDDDDELMPSKIEKQIALLEGTHNDAGMIYSGYCYGLERTGEIIHRSMPTHSGDVFVRFLHSNFIVMHAALVRRECVEKVGGLDESLPGCQDWDLWLRVSREFKCANLEEVLATVWVHGWQITSDLERKIRSREMIRGKYAKELANHPSIHAFHLSRLGKLYFLAGNKKRARAYLWQAYKLSPGQVKQLLHLAFSLAAPRRYSEFLHNRQFKVGDITFY